MASPTQQSIIQNCKTALREIERRVTAGGSSVNPDVRAALSAAMSALRLETKPSRSGASSGVSGTGGPTFAALLLRDGSVLTVLMSSLLWKKRKTSDASLTALRLLLPCPAAQLDARVTLHRFLTLGSSASPQDGPSVLHCRVGDGLFISLSYLLSNTSDTALQLHAVQLIQRLLGRDDSWRYLTARAVPDTIGACFTMALQSSQETVRTQCRRTLNAALKTVTKTFVLQSTTPPGAVQVFATTTILDNYTIDVEHNASFQSIHVVDSSLLLACGTQSQPMCDAENPHESHSRAATTAATAATSVTGVPPLPPSGLTSSPPPPPPITEPLTAAADALVFPDHSLDPNTIFSRSEDDTLLGLANTVLDENDRLPGPLKDFIVVLKHACRLASLPCSGTISESNTDIRARELGLEMLELILSDLPVANSPVEHPCAMWLSLAFASCRYNLLRCLTLNFSAIQPFSFFAAAVRVVALLLRKFHFHLSRELNTLLSVFLLPVVGSRYASFQQKHAVLSMIHSLFSVPHLVISFFTNYDCNPSFDAGGEDGGLLEQLIDFVSEMSFMDYSATTAVTPNAPSSNSSGVEVRGSLTADQETLLRCECMVIIHTLVHSLYRWTSEDPKEYAMGYLKPAPRPHAEPTSAGAATQKPTGSRSAPHSGARVGGPSSGLSELYLDNWFSSDDEDDTPAAAPGGGASATGTESTASRNLSFTVVNHKTGMTPLWGKNHNVLYHWKHIHCQWHNKRILQEAVSLTNHGKWKDALAFLVSRCVLPHIDEESTRDDLTETNKEDTALPEAAAPPSDKPEAEEGGALPADTHATAEDTAAAPPTTAATDDTAKGASEEAAEAPKEEGEDEDGDEEAEEDEGLVEPGTTSYASFARFLYDFPGIEREAVCRIFERVNKDLANKQVLVEYLHLFDYRGVPIDVALRDTTCKFMSWDRPMFEAGVWETIQRLFGREYARQNLGSITAGDADTMAGVLLFLHANLHNDVAKGSRMSCKAFVEDGNACLDFPMEERDITAMYERVAKHKWELDSFGRTPQQQEAAKSMLMRLSTKIRYERAVTRSAEQLTRDLQLLNQRMSAESSSGLAAAATAGDSFPAATPVGEGVEGNNASLSKDTLTSPMLQNVDQSVLNEVLRDVQHQGAGGGGAATSAGSVTATVAAAGAAVPASSQRSGASAGHDDIGYLDSSVPNYCEVRDTLRLRDPTMQQYTEVALMRLAKLEAVHRQFFCRGEQYHPQPYVVPYYAEHVKLIMQSVYPQVVACIYMGFRVLDESPIRRQLTDTLNLLFDLASAFVMNVGDLREVVDHAIQDHLAEDQAYRLLPPSRPTLVSFFLNYV